MEINQITRTPIINKVARTQETTTPKGAATQIVGNFQKMFDEVNSANNKADEKVVDVVSGRSDDVAGAMIAMEKAEVSTRMLMAVRNKAVSAYEEVMRMQI